ncbi:MAG: hypothetical protein OEM67_06155 [Thermoleophilia bacterium]|nr:hypothetical protein [Thermoleophilia bacterium]
MCRQLAAVAFCLLPLAPAAAGSGPELTLSAGLRTGEIAFTTEAYSPLIVCVTTPCVTADVVTEDEQVRLTLIVDVPVSPRWMIELLYTEQDGNHDFRSEFPSIVERGSYEWTTAQAGLLRHWGEGRMRPFAAATLGATRFESSVPGYDRPFFPGIVPTPVDEEVLSGSLAGGIKVGLGRYFDLRLESRGWWHDLPARLDGSLWQGEGSVGLSYHW